MSVSLLAWFVIGAAVGASHAVALWRAAHRPSRQGWAFLWRLPLVVAMLIAAALSGTLIAAAIGWTTGLTVTAGALLIGRKRWT